MPEILNREPVTCIIPVRNGEKTLERAVQSALKAGCDYVYIFDDQSIDRTDQIIYSLEKSYKYDSVRGFSLGTSVRSGPVFARNFLIEEAPNGLIIPLDCDDTLNNIKPLTHAYKPNTWVYGDHLQIMPDGQQIEGKASNPRILYQKNITGVTFLFHKFNWLQAGGYDPDFAYAEDYGFQCALVNDHCEPIRVDHVVYNRYLHEGGNARTQKAQMYWTFYRDLARSKYQSTFALVG